MHQTSSRLLRMTDDDRPFTKASTGSIGVFWVASNLPRPSFKAVETVRPLGEPTLEMERIVRYTGRKTGIC